MERIDAIESPVESRTGREDMQTQNRESEESRSVIALRLVRGVHTGAERRCGSGDVVVIGGGDDCDLILADAAVRAHHCIVSVIGDDIGLRAVEAAVRAGGREVSPGEPVRIAPFEVVEIGDAAFALGPAASEQEWTRVREAMATAANEVSAGTSAPAPRRPRWRLAIGIAATVAAVVTCAISAELLRPSAPTLETRQAMAEQIVRASDLPEVRVGGDRGRVRVSGIVPDPTQGEKLREALSRSPAAADVDLRSGSSIAHDVVDVLRLSGMQADGRYLNEGQVEVRGHFGDPAKLQKVVESRAMREVGGLRKVVTLNLDTPPAPAPSKPADDGKLIAEIIGGKDPYIVTRDGSRYYVGAKLPDGGILQAIDGQDVLVDTGKAVKHMARMDSINNG
jgi:type III secretion system YscD/HrpQ family protein